MKACFPWSAADIFFGSTAGADDPELVSALQRYHREGKTSNAEIMTLLKRDTGIDIR